MKKLGVWILIWAERLYLKLHGWERIEDEDYIPPADYEFKKHDKYHRCHAVNAQRQVYAEQTRKRNEEDLLSKLQASVKS